MRKNTGKLVKSALFVGVITLVLTFVLCFLIYIFLNKTSMALTDIPGDMFPGIVITGIICALLQIPTVKKKVKSGTLPEVQICEQAAYPLLPAKIGAYVISYSIISFAIWCCGTMGFLHVFFPALVMTRWGYIAFKSFVTGCAAGFMNYHANIFFVGVLQKK